MLKETEIRKYTMYDWSGKINLGEIELNLEKTRESEVNNWFYKVESEKILSSLIYSGIISPGMTGLAISIGTGAASVAIHTKDLVGVCKLVALGKQETVLKSTKIHPNYILNTYPAPITFINNTDT